jgi:hypothetical protein
MASNVLTAVLPKLLAQGLMALRQNAVTSRLCANMSSALAGKKGSTIDVPIPSAITAVAVTPAATAPVAGALSPDSVPVVLDQWWEAAFDLTDNEYEQAMDGIIPMQAEEAVKSIVNKVDQSILAQYVKFYGYFGTAGTTPFGSGVGVVDATGIRKILNKQLAPMSPRHVLLDPDAEANALGLEQFANMNFAGTVEAMRDGNLNRKVGMQWWMNQNMPLHTLNAIGAGAMTINGVHAIGVTTLSIAKAAGASWSAVEGDVFTIAGSTQTYVITAAVTVVHTANTNVTIQPPLVTATAGGEAITIKATRRINLAFHRDAIAFANRPLQPVAEGLGSISMSQVDPVSGLALRIEVTREFKRTRWSYDFLWGVKAVRRELGAVLAG